VAAGVSYLYGLASRAKTSVRLAALPLFTPMNTETKLLPILVSPS
jgi:hypothetical protein